MKKVKNKTPQNIFPLDEESSFESSSSRRVTVKSDSITKWEERVSTADKT